MSITVADCLKLPSLSQAKVVAGFAGLNKIVASVSVLEYAVPAALNQDYYFNNNEIVITAFISIMDDVAAQCATLRRLHEVGEVGLILYYVGLYLPRVDDMLIETANELGFPLIAMPEKQPNLRYSEAICEVMEAIFKDQMKKTYFVGEILNRISQLPNRQRIMDTVLRIVSDRIRGTLILTDRSYNILNAAAWPSAVTDHLQEIADYCKNNPSFISRSATQKIEIRDKVFSIRFQPVESENDLNLVILNEASEIPPDSCQQAAEIVRLFINIWSNHEGNGGAAELIRAILNDEPVKMRRLAEILHIDIAAIQTMWVLKNSGDSQTFEEEQARNTELMIRLKDFLQEQRRLAIVDVFEANVVAFMDNNALLEKSASLAAIFMAELDDASPDIILAICPNLENTTEVREAYVLLEAHLKNARIIYPYKKVLTYHEILFASGCYETIIQGEEAIRRNLLPLKPLHLEEHEPENELLATLATYMLDTEMNVSQTAQYLFVHKSTVKYRLHKINERLNYHILKPPESYRLYVALAIERLFNGLK